MSNRRHSFTEKDLAIITIRAKILKAAREWLDEKGYVEVQGPTLIPAVGNWPGHFEVTYFDKRAYLAQGLHPYSDIFLESLGKIYTVAPSFRSERAETDRHLTEYWRIEVANKCAFSKLIEIQGELLTHICHAVARTASKQLDCLGVSAEKYTQVMSPFPKLTYDEVILILQKDGFDIVWGRDIDWNMENQLSMKFSQPFFVTEFPEGFETLFFKSHPTKLGSTLTADLLAPEGYGEIGSGGQIEDNKKMLQKKMAEEDIDTKEQEWYFSLRRTKITPNSGFVFGLERLTQWICNLPNISTTTATPRSKDKIYP
jgi:asparaginyl-tRNA synthetase